METSLQEEAIAYGRREESDNDCQQINIETKKELETKMDENNKLIGEKEQLLKGRIQLILPVVKIERIIFKQIA